LKRKLQEVNEHWQRVTGIAASTASAEGVRGTIINKDTTKVGGHIPLAVGLWVPETINMSNLVYSMIFVPICAHLWKYLIHKESNINE